MPLSRFGNSIANQFAVQSKCSLSAVSMQSQRSLSAVSVESPWSLHSQRIRNALRLYGDCVETALRIIRSGVVVKVAKVWERHYSGPVERKKKVVELFQSS